jgi:hypothetical protein
MQRVARVRTAAERKATERGSQPAPPTRIAAAKKPIATIVVSLPVTDLERSLRFYRDGLGLQTPGIDEYMIAFELPNLSLFLIELSEYATYIERAGLASPSTTHPGALVEG